VIITLAVLAALPITPIALCLLYGWIESWYKHYYH
jgi:hypothetical protein